MLLTRLAAAAARLAVLAGLALTAAATAGSRQPPTVPPAPTTPPTAPARPAPAPGWRTAYVLSHDAPVTALACTADRLAAGTEAGELFLCDPATGKNRVRKLPPLKGGPPGAAVFDHLRFNPDGGQLFFIRGGGTMAGFTRPGDADGKAWGLQGRPVFAGLAPDGKAWLEASGRTILIRPNPYHPGGGGGANYESGTRYNADVTHAVLSPPDGKWLAVATADGIVHVHDRADRDGDRLNPAAVTLDLGRHRPTALSFSPGGERLAAVGHDGFARVYDATTGKERAVLKGHGGIVFAVAFSPDGKTVVTGGDDGVVRVYDAATGRLRAERKGHTDSVKVVLFDPSGRVLFTASADKTVRAWTPPG